MYSINFDAIDNIVNWLGKNFVDHPCDQSLMWPKLSLSAGKSRRLEITRFSNKSNLTPQRFYLLLWLLDLALKSKWKVPYVEDII